MYSSLDTICVGTGDGNEELSAGNNSFSCSSVRNLMRPPYRILQCSMSPQQHTQDCYRRRGVDAERPGQDGHVTSQLGDFSLDCSQPAFYVLKPNFQVVQPVFYLSKSAFYAG